MATLGDFRTEVTSILGLDANAAAELALVDGWVNEAIVDIVLRTRCRVIPVNMSLTAGVDDYTISYSIMVIIDLFVTSDTTGYSMTRVSPAELFDYRRQNASTAAPPVRLYAIAGSNQMMVYPVPTAADEISMLYVPRPATLDSSGDSPSEIPPEWHKLVVFYALFRGADYDDDASSQMGQNYLALYEQGIKEMRGAISRKGNYRLTPARLRNRRVTVSNPSTSTAFL